MVTMKILDFLVHDVTPAELGKDISVIGLGLFISVCRS